MVSSTSSTRVDKNIESQVVINGNVIVQEAKNAKEFASNVKKEAKRSSGSGSFALGGR